MAFTVLISPAWASDRFRVIGDISKLPQGEYICVQAAGPPETYLVDGDGKISVVKDHELDRRYEMETFRHGLVEGVYSQEAIQHAAMVLGPHYNPDADKAILEQLKDYKGEPGNDVDPPVSAQAVEKKSLKKKVIDAAANNIGQQLFGGSAPTQTVLIQGIQPPAVQQPSNAAVDFTAAADHSDSTYSSDTGWTVLKVQGRFALNKAQFSRIR